MRRMKTCAGRPQLFIGIAGCGLRVSCAHCHVQEITLVLDSAVVLHPCFVSHFQVALIVRIGGLAFRYEQKGCWQAYKCDWQLALPRGCKSRQHTPPHGALMPGSRGGKSSPSLAIVSRNDGAAGRYPSGVPAAQQCRCSKTGHEATACREVRRTSRRLQLALGGSGLLLPVAPHLRQHPLLPLRRRLPHPWVHLGNQVAHHGRAHVKNV